MIVRKNVIDRTFSDISSTVPWTAHAEWVTARRLDRGRLSEAAMATLREHPLLRARQGHEPDSWLVPDTTVSAPVEYSEAEHTDRSLERSRNTAVSRSFDLCREGPVRFHHIRTAIADHVVVVVDHALVDGVGIGRAALSLVTHYDGRSSSPPDERWRSSRRLITAAPSPERIEQTLQMMRRRSLPTAVRMATEHHTDSPGCGVAYHELSDAAVRCLRDTSSHQGRPTANDVVVSSFCLVAMRWNRSQGKAVVPLTVGVPVNLRPARYWFDGVCNATLPWPVRIESENPVDVLQQVANQLRPVRCGLYSADVRAVLASLATRTTLPLRLRHALATTTVVSTVPVPPAAERALRRPDDSLYGGAPVSPVMGITFAVAAAPSRWRLSARYLLSRFSEGTVRSLLTAVEDEVMSLKRLVGGLTASEPIENRRMEVHR